MNLSGLAGRIAYAVLAGVVAFLVVFIIGAIVAHFEAAIGSKLEAFSPLIGLLVGLVYFFARPNSVPPVV
jgi:hypothetical protein